VAIHCSSAASDFDVSTGAGSARSGGSKPDPSLDGDIPAYASVLVGAIAADEHEGRASLPCERGSAGRDVHGLCRLDLESSLLR
jgi:hypothetical protein